MGLRFLWQPPTHQRINHSGQETWVRLPCLANHIAIVALHRNTSPKIRQDGVGRRKMEEQKFS